MIHEKYPFFHFVILHVTSCLLCRWWHGCWVGAKRPSLDTRPSRTLSRASPGRKRNSRSSTQLQWWVRTFSHWALRRVSLVAFWGCACVFLIVFGNIIYLFVCVVGGYSFWFRNGLWNARHFIVIVTVDFPATMILIRIFLSITRSYY